MPIHNKGKPAKNRLTQEEFLKRCKKKYNNKYDYAKTKYVTYESLITIICPEHGEYKQIAANHLQSGGCKKCGTSRSSKKLRCTLEDFIKTSKCIHENKYDYSKAVYGLNNQEKVCITCLSHGDFLQSPDNHINKKSGCPKCMIDNRKYTTEEFIAKAKIVHTNLYSYENSDYKKHNEKIAITCKKHGIFWQNPENHLAGKGCTKCIRKEEYRLEQMLRCRFNDMHIDTQKAIYSEEHGRVRYFDFLLTKGYNKIIVEYDGKQHFVPVRFSAKMTKKQAKYKFDRQKETDRLDAAFCNSNGIVLFRVKYNENFENACDRIAGLIVKDKR